MPYTIAEIAEALNARAVGKTDLLIEGAAEPAEAGPRHLAMAMGPKYAEGLPEGKARAAILWDGADYSAFGLEAAIFVPRPRYAMSGITRLLDPGPGIAPEVHPTAVIHETAQIGPGAAIGPYAVIGADVVIGENARIAAHVTIDEGARLGAECLLWAGVRICHRVTIGDRFIAQPSAVIGGDGFSFVTPEKGAVESVRESLGTEGAQAAQSWTRIHSLGGVEIGDDVEVGSNSAIDRGTIRATRIGSRTKIDNLVQIGHNCVVGEDVLICGQAGLAGSSRVGNRVVIGGRVAVNDNIFVGDDVVAGGGAMIFTNAPAGRVLMGNPAVKMETQIEINKAMRRLPRMMKQFAELQKSVSKLVQKD
ncbi:UDP-3-O-(3-hydroxymyristoyl)glucosamine N-acyltransferase [Pseudoruegeria sp. SHC-113]|uniref:UDP-3-O-(3-hydroxymyristoyl)glucosamine N-acyltransferase n=1 Tax=Pseudoruegeria sp. SHC-113 TaxID=2855439 RepID=UPI0021BA9962|nr:UDP-3-O-(3-hydroxymyristoyl)glucosamine N-acyltransferase [Pseudoruegeria sp. SHC-113]MCT8160562.1 UDP-3-O-(3-hydroxymyristoyl)glucosamine N-acyltransferase [Pseudoruegeria sp. SHC-113]